MNYEEALDFIHGTLKFGSKLGLENISRLMELMGDPHKKLRFVHVAGTNGKGSTVSFISSILIQAGYKTGIYTSPYIQRFTERIRVGNDEISHEELAKIAAFVKTKIDIMVGDGYNHPTEFEIVTAIALQYYYEQKCDIVVLEVGLGGRFDSTNVIDKPLVAVITTISYDHTELLGDTLAKIAYEKAGIIKSGCDVVLYPQQAEAQKVFVEVCKEFHASLGVMKAETINLLRYDIDGQAFDYDDLCSLEISLLGEHQSKNAAMAVETSKVLIKNGFKIDEKAIRDGLKNARWPGRLEVLSKKPIVLIDGAHNEEGAVMLRLALDTYFPESKITFILGVLGDKNYKAMIEAVAPRASKFIAVTPNTNRAMPADQLAIILKQYCMDVTVSDTIKEAISRSVESVGEDEIVCAFGSLYYIGEVRSYFDTIK